MLGDVSSHEHRFQIDPHVLDKQPPLQDLVGVGKVLHPLLDLLAERRVVPVKNDSLILLLEMFYSMGESV